MKTLLVLLVCALGAEAQLNVISMLDDWLSTPPTDTEAQDYSEYYDDYETTTQPQQNSAEAKHYVTDPPQTQNANPYQVQPPMQPQQQERQNGIQNHVQQAYQPPVGQNAYSSQNPWPTQRQPIEPQIENSSIQVQSSTKPQQERQHNLILNQVQPSMQPQQQERQNGIHNHVQQAYQPPVGQNAYSSQDPRPTQRQPIEPQIENENSCSHSNQLVQYYNEADFAGFANKFTENACLEVKPFITVCTKAAILPFITTVINGYKLFGAKYNGQRTQSAVQGLVETGKYTTALQYAMFSITMSGHFQITCVQEDEQMKIQKVMFTVSLI